MTECVHFEFFSQNRVQEIMVWSCFKHQITLMIVTIVLKTLGLIANSMDVVFVTMIFVRNVSKYLAIIKRTYSFWDDIFTSFRTC